MNYDEALSYIHSTYRFGSKLGLENIRTLLKLMGNPQNELRFIHVAGTNGKGSTCAMLNQILLEEGYSVGLFTSPYLETFNERIRLNGFCIENADLATCTAFVKSKVDKMLGMGLSHPTEFEIVTAIAMDFYKRQKVDFVILEVGMGGRLDSTNVIERPLMSLITPIAIDHTDYLGDSLDKIAYEKAGIIKRKSVVVSAPQKPEVLAVLQKKSRDASSPLYVADPNGVKINESTVLGSKFDTSWYEDVELPLAGEHQVENCNLVLTAVHVLNAHLNMGIRPSSVREGLKKVVWTGRLEVLQREPLFIIDGAHNVHGARALKAAIERYLKDYKVVGLIGVLEDKDYRGIFDIVAPTLSRVVATTPENPRALAAKKLKEQLESYHIPCYVVEKIKNAAEYALQSLAQDEVLVCFGSLYLIGNVRSWYRNRV